MPHFSEWTYTTHPTLPSLPPHFGETLSSDWSSLPFTDVRQALLWTSPAQEHPFWLQRAPRADSRGDAHNPERESGDTLMRDRSCIHATREKHHLISSVWPGSDERTHLLNSRGRTRYEKVSSIIFSCFLFFILDALWMHPPWCSGPAAVTQQGLRAGRRGTPHPHPGGSVGRWKRNSRYPITRQLFTY